MCSFCFQANIIQYCFMSVLLKPTNVRGKPTTCLLSGSPLYPGNPQYDKKKPPIDATESTASRKTISVGYGEI
jgi:hypothetical protein